MLAREGPIFELAELQFPKLRRSDAHRDSESVKKPATRVKVSVLPASFPRLYLPDKSRGFYRPVEVAY